MWVPFHVCGRLLWGRGNLLIGGQPGNPSWICWGMASRSFLRKGLCHIGLDPLFPLGQKVLQWEAVPIYWLDGGMHPYSS